MTYLPRLKQKYNENIKLKLKAKFGYECIMQLPKLVKIVINQGINISRSLTDRNLLKHAMENLSLISGQKAIVCQSKRDESGFKLRKGTPISLKVTLRRNRMSEFLDRLINLALPRVRDFNGVNKNSFDGKGNYNLGVREQIIFPEIKADLKTNLGMNITFVTDAKSDKEAKYLLYSFGLPFKK
ncbi:MAG: 50S ribosomal protein L5 [Candidatus Karelsulcia muelleri]